MSRPASRRALLGGLAALPALTVPVIAATDPDAAFVALAPRLVPLLNRYDELWAASGGFYDPGFAEVQRATARGATWEQAQAASPLWQAYMRARAPADQLNEDIDLLLEPFMDHRAVTIPGVLLKARIAATFEYWEDDALANVIAIAKLPRTFA